MAQITKKNRRPPKWVEMVVMLSVFSDRRSYLIDLRKRYRRRLRVHGEEAAMQFARREAGYWILIGWPVRVFAIGRLIMRLSS
jgi:hypothetical protein